jgi:hypothetical protein
LTLRFAADENFDGRIVRGLLRILPDLDLIRVQDTTLAESDDDSVLESAKPIRDSPSRELKRRAV